MVSTLFQTPLARQMLFLSFFHLLVYLSSWVWGISAVDVSQENAVRDFFETNGTASGSGSAHTNNWAVLVCASRYWFNYRVCVVCLFLKSCLMDVAAYGKCPWDVGTPANSFG